MRVRKQMNAIFYQLSGIGVRLALSLGATLSYPAVAHGQAQREPLNAVPPAARANAASDNVCLGFMFAPWTPALDWRAAGHGPIDSARVPEAPTGRRWAMPAGSSGTDSTLLLVPPWWPAGVVVTVPARGLAMGDTVAGRAMALVADGRLTAPTAKVRAWRVPCR